MDASTDQNATLWSGPEHLRTAAKDEPETRTQLPRPIVVVRDRSDEAISPRVKRAVVALIVLLLLLAAAARVIHLHNVHAIARPAISSSR